MTDMHAPKADASQQEPVTEENVLNRNEAMATQTTNSEETVTPIVAEATTEVSALSCADIIARVKELAEAPLDATKEELDYLKQTFYKLRRIAIENAREAHIANGGAYEDFKVDSAEEDEYKAAQYRKVKEEAK